MADLRLTDLGAVAFLSDTHVTVVDNGTATNKATLPQLRKYMVGALTDLTTTVKTSIVAAINEIVGKITNKVLFYENVACLVTTGDFTTISNAAITADHIVTECVFANPSAITTDVTWTTAAGSLTLNGTCSAATTVTITLIKKDN